MAFAMRGFFAAKSPKKGSSHYMLLAIILFAATYVLMLTFGKYRPYIALASGVVFVATGMLPLYL